MSLPQDTGEHTPVAEVRRQGALGEAQFAEIRRRHSIREPPASPEHSMRVLVVGHSVLPFGPHVGGAGLAGYYPATSRRKSSNRSR